MDPLLLTLLTEESLFVRCLKYGLLSTRRYAAHPINQERGKFGGYHHLFRQLRRDEWKFFEYKRMSIDSFDILLNLIQDELQSNIRLCEKRRISPEERLVVTLRFLITGSSFRSLAFTFRMGKTTISKIVFETCQVLWYTLQPDYIPAPTKPMLRNNVNDFFRRWSFPNCWGCIDGKHCQFKCPPNSGSTYFNYLKYFSIVLQGVADADKKFLMIDVGGYGRQHDSSTFRTSTLFQKLEAGAFPAPVEMTIPDTDVKMPTFVIGDEAYPLLPYLIRPYSGKTLTPVKDGFNKRLSRARKCIECAFGILTRKFQVLMKSIETKEQTAYDIIKCACVLHNYIRTRDGESDLDYRFMVNKFYESNIINTPQVHYAGRRNNPSRTAKDMRDTLANYFRTH